MKAPRTSPARLLVCGLLLGIAGLMCGCRSPHEKYVFPPLPGNVPQEAYTDHPYTHRLLPGEEVTFHFPDGTNYTARIQEDGSINLPLMGNISAAGKTPSELWEEMGRLYVPRFYKRWTNPNLPGQRVYYVGGEVRSPGRQVYFGSTTVTSAIQSAGGFTDYAAQNRVELTRASGQKIHLNCIKAAKDPTLVYCNT